MSLIKVFGTYKQNTVIPILEFHQKYLFSYLSCGSIAILLILLNHFSNIAIFVKVELNSKSFCSIEIINILKNSTVLNFKIVQIFFAFICFSNMFYLIYRSINSIPVNISYQQTKLFIIHCQSFRVTYRCFYYFT